MKKRTVSFVMALIMSVSLFAAFSLTGNAYYKDNYNETYTETYCNFGDVNNDGYINLADAMIVFGVVAETDTTKKCLEMDMDCDGSITLSDAMLIFYMCTEGTNADNSPWIVGATDKQLFDEEIKDYRYSAYATNSYIISPNSFSPEKEPYNFKLSACTENNKDIQDLTMSVCNPEDGKPLGMVLRFPNISYSRSGIYSVHIEFDLKTDIENTEKNKDGIHLFVGTWVPLYTSAGIAGAVNRDVNVSVAKDVSDSPELWCVSTLFYKNLGTPIMSEDGASVHYSSDYIFENDYSFDTFILLESTVAGEMSMTIDNLEYNIELTTLHAFD